MQFVSVLANQVLGVVMTVEVLSLGVLSRSSMITADDEVSRSKVFANNGMPEGFTGSSHAHGERKKCEVTHSIRVFLHDSLVYTDTGIMIDVTRFCETNNGMNENVLVDRLALKPSLALTNTYGSVLTCSTNGQLTVSTMHRVSRLEGDNTAPCEFCEVSPKLSRGI